METTNIICPVCTLYLRPGMTLKSHLTSHPKQKVIEALVRLSGLDESLHEPAETNCGQNLQINTSVVNQSWNQENPVMPSNVTSMQDNHVFIYQKSMSTTGPPTNVLNVNPLSSQYIVHSVMNPQVMPYIYQQQQVIMSSSGSCVPPQIRVLELSGSSAESPSSDNEASVNIEEVRTINECNSTNLSDPDAQETEVTIQNDADLAKTELIEKIHPGTSKDLEQDVIYKPDQESEIIIAEDYSEPVEKILSVSEESSWDSRQQEDLNKACQTQSNVTINSPIRDEENANDSEMKKDYFYFNSSTNNTPFSSVAQGYEQSGPIYSNANMLQPTDQMDFGEVDAMQVFINDFPQNQIISQVENFENSRLERPGVLMTIGGMVDSVSYSADVDESGANVNIRADERMPPCGELSGQESIGGVSDINWNRIQYSEGSSGMSSYDLTARESWDASDASDVDAPTNSHSANAENDEPTIISYTAPPMNFKCSICGEGFVCLKDRKEHDSIKHPEKLKSKLNIIGSRTGKRKVKKLVVKPKSESEANYDNVFTNKLKKEEKSEADVTDAAVPAEPLFKDDPNSITDLRTVCSICNQIVEDPKALKEHQSTIHQTEERFKCATCGEPFPNEYKYTEHLKVHPLECRLCGKLFYRRQNIQLHMKRHLGIKPYKCESCSKSFLTKQKLEEHRNVHTGNAPIKCTMCDETFRRHSNLVQHKNRHHFNVKRKVKDYVCFCGEFFHSKKKLAWHKEIHDSKPKSCTKCSEKFIHMASLTRHMRRAHNERFLPKEERSSENVECPICKGVYLRSSLEVHLRNHRGVRPFTCLICSKDFTTKWNLKLHKWTHASRVSKPFKCDQCKGAFIRESDYISHMNSHKSIRPYTCNHCGAQFIRKYNCHRHVKEHENKKNFVCTVCGKSFHRSYYLKDHMRVHSGIRPYSCHVCGKTSTTKSNHNKHVQIHHAREPQPFWIVEFQSEEDVIKVANRSVCLRSCMELWVHAQNFDGLHEKLKNCPKSLFDEYFTPSKSFKIEVETFCKHFSQKEKVQKIETFSYLPVQGPVKLTNPDVLLQYIEYYGTLANSPPELPYDLFFGRWVANGLRQLIKTFSLKTRKFIGNTSMDPQLALLMANQAQVKEGNIVLDPFVGSGSLLVAAAQFGGYVFGADIDYLMLHGRTRPSRISQEKRDDDESVRANMKQYNLEHLYLDILVNDFAMPFWKDTMRFDSIITDPPYGIREATEKVGTLKEDCSIREEHLPTHIPAKVEYGISNIYRDLLAFSAKHLQLGGHLVCWFPVFRETYSEEGLPSHPCLKLTANSEQVLSKVTSRRLLTFQKIREPTKEELNHKVSIIDFREEYFVVREETRKERRMREAKIREQNRIAAEKRKQQKDFVQ